MCGIVGYVGRHAATPVLLGGLRRLEYRGYDSAGLSVQDGKELLTLRAVGKVSRLADKVRAEWPEELQTRRVVGIAHTRWATHGAPTEANAHPHADASGRIRLVHNGIIENYRAIRAKLEAKDFIKDGALEIGGHLPINTHGGQLGEAYIHGMNGIAEAVRQVRGTSVNQVDKVENVLVTAGTGVPTSGLILGVDR